MAPPLLRMSLILSKPVILLTVLILHTCLLSVQSVELNLFYPFGPNSGDKTMKPADDASSIDVRVQEEFFLFNNSYRNIYVNTNGHISFDSEFPAYRVDRALPLGYHLVAPLYADIDTRGVGRIYYRNTTDPDAIQRAAADIQTYFAGFQDYMPTTLFIVTWDRVGYFEQQTDLTNTFQLILASDGKDTFSLFHYLDNGINWQRSQGKFTPTYPDIPPQAGFDGGEGGENYLLPGSGETGSFVTGSNVNVPGVWMFHIGGATDGKVRPANLNIEEVSVFKPKAQSGCAQAEGVCHVNAKCVENSNGFCCECIPPYYGNGFECLSKGIPQTLNSRMYGQVNGVTLGDNVFMHTYVVTTDGRTYSAISEVPPSIATAMQTLNSIGGIIGWLFASPINPQAKNGFSLTGAKFNRTAKVTFQNPGGDDQEIIIRQSFFGHQAPNNIRMETRLDGTLPDIPLGSEIKIDDYIENYSKNGKGLIKSYAARTFRVNGVGRRYTWENTITYDECDDGKLDQGPDTVRLSVGKHYVRYNQEQRVVRYAMTSKVGLAGDSDPCASLGKQCHKNAECVTKGDSHQCVCTSGYYGNGATCLDVDECRQNICDRNARCQNLPGSYRCQCNPGYKGDGRICQPEVALCGSYVCDTNARCVFDPAANERVCECNTGFRGDGQRCSVVETNCRNADICGENAQCVYDDVLREYVCECLDDFSGDGYSCESVDPGCNSCDRHAECVQNTLTFKESCQCKPGFTGNGRECSMIDSCSRCDSRAQCMFDDRISQYRCVCSRGYRGDGETCTQVDCRNETNMCASEGGLCWLNPANNFAICRCNIGYRGDGFRCEKIGCDVYNDCDTNAKCVVRNREYVCECNDGFIGTGRRCRPDTETTCDVYNDCDINARCTPDSNNPPRYSCQCNTGFEGDGKRCRAAAPCNEVNFCDRNAACVFSEEDKTYRCECNQGYRGDGMRCQQLAVSTCTDYNDCDRDARCVPDGSNPPIYSCRCNPGFRGDGKRCEATAEVSTCTDYNDCDRDARCVPDGSNPPIYSCRCNPGFRGDGKRCEAEPDASCNQVDHCDGNAACVYNPDSRSYSCVCNRGYEGDGKICRRKDVPDCRRNPRLCDRNAECVKGSVDDKYVCVCKQGYRGNGATCSYVVSEGDKLIYAQGSKLMKVSVDPQPGDIGQQIAYLSGQLAVGIDIDCKDQLIYWSDVANGIIHRSDMDGNGMESVVSGLKSPEGVAIDFVARNLFYTDSELDVVQVSTLDGQSIKTLVDTDMVNPRAIVLDITKGTVFWTDWNRNKPQIEKMNMDGTGRSILVYNDLRLPNGLAFDNFSQLLCWGDAGEKRIECVLSDGTGRRVVTADATYPFDITMLNNNIFWSDWKKRNIPNVNQNGGALNNPLTLAVGGHGRLYGITSVRDQCPRVRNSCALNNGGCTFLCLASPNGGRTCACPDGTDPRLC